jgi:hypothetical protein
MPPSLASQFLEHGGATGLLALLEAFVIIALWRWGRATNEARIVEMGKGILVIEKVTNALDKLTDTVLGKRR